jgi:hypothetical protein
VKIMPDLKSTKRFPHSTLGSSALRLKLAARFRSLSVPAVSLAAFSQFA